MKIHKILNNNVVVTLEQSGNELIIMGRGIGFKKKEGDEVDAALVEKQFCSTNKETLPKFAALLSEIPMEVVQLSEKIIDYAKSIVGEKLQDSIYISLTDHIHFAILRHQQGCDIPNGFLWEIKKFYPQEFKIGQYALSLIKKHVNVDLAEDEAGFIAFHIINAQLNDTIPHIMAMTNIIREILHIVKYHFKFEFDEQSLTYQRVITHLKFFAHRLLNDNAVPCLDQSLYDIVKEKYHQSYLCIKRIDLYLIKQYQRPLTDDESLYLTIHIERLKNELNHQTVRSNL